MSSLWKWAHFSDFALWPITVFDLTFQSQLVLHWLVKSKPLCEKLQLTLIMSLQTPGEGKHQNEPSERVPSHSGPTEKVQASHRSLNMADAATGKRFHWPIVWFCDVIFTHGFGILQVRDVYDGEVSFICSICHTILTIILEIVRVKSAVLTLPKCQQRAVLITSKRKRKP